MLETALWTLGTLIVGCFIINFFSFHEEDYEAELDEMHMNIRDLYIRVQNLEQVLQEDEDNE